MREKLEKKNGKSPPSFFQFERERERERERESPTKNEKNLLSAQKNPPFRSASSPTNIRRKF
jgi:hypothetical protein